MQQAIYIDPFASPFTCGVASLSFSLNFAVYTYACAFGMRDDVMLELYLEMGWINYITSALLKAKMIVLFNAICFIFMELSTYTRLAERGQTDNISSRWSHARSREDLNRLDWVPCSRNISCYDRSNAAIKSCYFLVSSFSLHFGSFCGEKITYSALTERIFFENSVLVCFFRPKQKKLELPSMFFSTARPRVWGIFGSSLLRKTSRNSQISKQNFCFERRLIASPPFFANVPCQKGTTRANYRSRNMLSCTQGWLLWEELTPSAGLPTLYK